MITHRVLGLMSGSSLDGIDLALCAFDWRDDSPAGPIRNWRIVAADTVGYTDDWHHRLRRADKVSGKDLIQLHADYGQLLGTAAHRFLNERELTAELVGCHGYALFHEPERGYSFQLGEGTHIAAAAGLPTVTDLRTGDVTAGGQGAPLAPVADRHLFPDHRAFLNLGGIANFSITLDDGRVAAGDVSGCCQIFDRLAQLAGRDYDDGGELARSGSNVSFLASRLDALDYHDRPYPKSLSNAWVVDTLWPVLRDHPAPVPDRLHTFTHWLARRIAHDMLREGAERTSPPLEGPGEGGAKVMVTGGGARNTYLVERLNHHLSSIVPNPVTADFKEAALIALCALFRAKSHPNSIATATGALADTINGAYYLPPTGVASEASQWWHERGEHPRPLIP